MKLKALLALSLIICAGVSANAAEIKISDDSGRVTINESVKSSSEAVLIVMKSGEEIGNTNEMYAIWDTIPNNNGICTWSFSMPEKNTNEEVSDGEYDLYIKQNGQTLKRDKMTYASLESRNRVSTSLKQVASEDSFCTIIKNEDNLYALKVFGFAMDLFELSDKDKILKNVYESIDDFSDINEVSKGFNFGVAIDGLNKGINILKYLEIINPEFEEEKFSDIGDEKRISWICEIMGENEYTKAEDITQIYELANILYIINNSRVILIEGELDNYAEKIGIESSDKYKVYLNVGEKYDINKEICERLEDKPARNIMELLGIIEGAVDEIGKTTSGKPADGNGGSNGGGENGFSVVVPGVDNSKNKSDDVFYTPGSETSGFKDMNEAMWAEAAVNKLADMGIISGDGDGRFRPNDTITREEFVKMLVMAIGKYDENSECDFSDTYEGAWHYKYIASAYASGIVNGISGTEFGTGSMLTREDLAVLCRRSVAEYENKRESVVFADDDIISDYAREAVYDLYRAGVINGMGNNLFSPESFATRAQSAMIIYSLLNK